MLKVDGYDIYFVHKPHDATVQIGVNGSSSISVGNTTCVIELNREPFAESVAYCSSLDKFSKSTGRKISLARALSSFPKEFRTAVWQEYIKTTSHL